MGEYRYMREGWRPRDVIAVGLAVYGLTFIFARAVAYHQFRSDGEKTVKIDRISRGMVRKEIWSMLPGDYGWISLADKNVGYNVVVSDVSGQLYVLRTTNLWDFNEIQGNDKARITLKENGLEIELYTNQKLGVMGGVDNCEEGNDRCGRWRKYKQITKIKYRNKERTQ